VAVRSLEPEVATGTLMDRAHGYALPSAFSFQMSGLS